MSDEKKLHSRDAVLASLDEGATLSGVDLSGVDLNGADLQGVDLSGCRMRYTELSRANLQGALLRDANLRHASLVGADLRFADLGGADLSKADLHGVIIGETRFHGAKADHAKGVRPEVFFPRQLFERLVARDGVSRDAEKGVLHIDGDPRAPYRLIPASRIVECESGEAHGELLGRVMTKDALAIHGAEAVEGFVLLDDASYRAEDGWVGLPTGDGTKGPDDQDTDSQAVSSEPGGDTKLLEDFLLEKLK